MKLELELDPILRPWSRRVGLVLLALAAFLFLPANADECCPPATGTPPNCLCPDQTSPPCYDVWVRVRSTTATEMRPDVEVWNREGADCGFEYRIYTETLADNEKGYSCTEGNPPPPCVSIASPAEKTSVVTPRGPSATPPYDLISTGVPQLTANCGQRSTQHCGSIQACDFPPTSDCKGTCVREWILKAEITHHRQGNGAWQSVVPAKRLCKRVDDGGQCWTYPATATCCQGESCSEASKCSSDQCPGFHCVGSGASCQTDQDCPSGQTCVNSHCTGSRQPCDDETDCPSGQTCTAGVGPWCMVTNNSAYCISVAW